MSNLYENNQVTFHAQASASENFQSLHNKPSEAQTHLDALPTGSEDTRESQEGRPVERNQGISHRARGTAAMDPRTRQEVARKGGLAVSRNRQHMAEIGRKGGQAVSKNREHMAEIGRKGRAAARNRQ
jgi:uncharacterized protein